MREDMAGEESHKKVVFLLFLFMIIGIIIFMIWSYGIVQETVPDCEWEMPERATNSVDTSIASEQDAVEVVLNLEETGENLNISAEEKVSGHWDIELKNGSEIQEKYGVTDGGKIYKYEEICYEEDRTIIESIKRLLSDVGEMENRTDDL
ncbi:MAG: hypothetical protein ACLFTQ_04065 [Candidatus Aenigmatarchaeota archaeon]